MLAVKRDTLLTCLSPFKVSPTRFFYYNIRQLRQGSYLYDAQNSYAHDDFDMWTQVENMAFAKLGEVSGHELCPVPGDTVGQVLGDLEWKKRIVS
jgi:hypothetical protein